jgi:hypothetical protein
VEFQKKIIEFQEKGISIIGISYDSVQVLKEFAEKYQITYPLLSDVNSDVIRMFGIFNTSIDSKHRWYGIPYPGIYIVDNNLTVVKKQFEKTYYERPTAETVLIKHLDKKVETFIQRFKNSYMTGSFAISDTMAYPAQILTISIHFSMKNNFHLYGRPIPKGYIPLTIELEQNLNVSLDPIQFPATKKLAIESINETFNIFPNEFTLITSLRVKKQPQLGKYSLKVHLKSQACDDKSCMLPEELNFQFPLLITKTLRK